MQAEGQAVRQAVVPQARNWTRIVRVAAALAGPGLVFACQLITFLPDPYGVWDWLPFTLIATAVAAVPFALYALFVRGRTMTLIAGAVLLIPTAAACVYGTIAALRDGSGGFGNALFWAGLAAVVIDYLVIAPALVIDAVVRNRAAQRPRAGGVHGAGL